MNHRAVRAGVQRDRHPHHAEPACAHRAARRRPPAGRRDRQRPLAGTARAHSSTRSSSTTACWPTTSCTTQLVPGSANLGEVDHEALHRRAARRPCAPTRRALPTVPHRRRRRRPQHPRRRLRRTAALQGPVNGYRSAVVTGASGGIGRAIVTELVRLGMHVHALALDDAALRAISDIDGVTVIGIDVRDPTG